MALVRAAQGKQQPFDLILMDFQMPVMTGPEAAYEMRKDGFKGWIIGVTGNALDVDLEHFISQGADRVLTKPVSLRSLRIIIAGGLPVGGRWDACVAEL